MDENLIRRVVQEVIESLLRGPQASITPAAGGGVGVFQTINEAVQAAVIAQKQLMGISLEVRARIIEAIRETARRHAEDFSRRKVEETNMGRVEDEIAKHMTVANKTPGLEILQTDAFSGDHGLTIQEMAPYGVIGAVTPVTHPTPTMINNAISIITAGNSVVFNPHPRSKRVFAYAIDVLNRAIAAAGGPTPLVSCIAEPTLESSRELFQHPDIRLLLVTGGPGVVAEAMKSSKKVIAAGPGNPPVVVDETADIPRAARDIIAGASFDNNVLCIGEKEVFAVEAIFDALKKEMIRQGCVELNREQIDALARIAFGVKDGPLTYRPGVEVHLNRDLVGKNADYLAKQIGLSVPASCRLLIGETPFEHLWVMEEQMMPFLPLVRARNADHAIEMAVIAERNYGHTAVCHSRNVAVMDKMARLVNTTLFIKNGPCFAGLGSGGEGYTSFSIASPTGEGITTARHFTRQRRCVLVDYFRIT
ncbi:MAG: aldehyde dehydrogenase EutE [Candidatus Sumerlaeia bacterium]|nr:aldehyde dehydrogenase EutE [Candidatus Sumerlaeia bacterium]